MGCGGSKDMGVKAPVEENTPRVDDSTPPISKKVIQESEEKVDSLEQSSLAIETVEKEASQQAEQPPQ
jgi:hypothetical protein